MRYKPGAALALLISLAAAGCGQPSEPPREEATPVVVYQVQPDTIRDRIILSGTAAPWQHVTLSAEIGGKVVEVAQRGDESDSDSRREIREGDRVSAGELIFGIDTATLEADLRAAEASAEYARQNYARYERLHRQDAASDEELERFRAQTEQAAAAVNAARARLDQAYVRSPIDGTIDRKYIDQGANVTVGEQLAEIVNIERLKVVVAIPENAIRYINQGDELELSFDVLPDTTVSGRVIFVAATADPMTLTFPVHLEVDNSEGRLRAGNIAKVRLVKRVTDNAVVAPLPALMTGVTGPRVMVAENGIARGRHVRLGIMDNGNFEILSGLEPGDLLIVQGQREAVEGQPVDIQYTARDLNEVPQILLRNRQKANGEAVDGAGTDDSTTIGGYQTDKQPEEAASGREDDR